MKLYSGKLEEYRKRHNPIWDDLQKLLKQKGVINYSIFHDPDTDVLFGYAEITSETQWQEIADSVICQKWWESMAPLMETNEDNSPRSKDLEEIFHLD